MENKDLLLKAIDNYSIYSDTKRDVLKQLVRIEVHGTACISGKELSERIQKSKGGVFVALRTLERDGFIKKERKSGQLYSVYKLDQESLRLLIQTYLNKQNR